MFYIIDSSFCTSYVFFTPLPKIFTTALTIINPANNLGISPLPRYAGLGLYSFSVLHRAEQSVDCEAQNSTIFSYTFLTYFLPTGEFTYFVITFLAYVQHLAHPSNRTLSVRPTIKNGIANKRILSKFYKIALRTRRA